MTETAECVIVGGGAQGLSLAWNLAQGGMRRVVVFDAGRVGGGASSRNGEMIRSAFASEAWIRFFDCSLRLWETLSAELDFNVMYTRCGYLVLATTARETALCRENHRRQREFGLKTDFLDAGDVRRLLPALAPGMAGGGVLQKDGGFARHDAVVWAYEGAAKRLGVSVRPFTRVTGIEVSEGVVRAVLTASGRVSTPRVVVAAGGHSREVAALAGVALPTETHRLEMLVTEPLKPFLRPMLASLHVMGYMHQTTRGEFCGGTEYAGMRPSRTIRSSFTAALDMAKKFTRLFPGLSGVRMMRQWGGLVDQAPDVAPILGPVAGVAGLFLDCGWVYGFMGAPAGGHLMARCIVDGVVPPEVAPFLPSRFARGELASDASLVVSGDGEEAP